MSVWNTVRTWFFEHIWPLIQSFLMLVVEKIIEWISEQVNTFLDDSAERLAENARSKAHDEFNKAKSEIDAADAEKHRAVAEVWQRVAEDILEENTRIKGRLADVFTREKAEFATRIEALQPEDVFENLSSEEVKLKFGGTNLVVPATILRESQPEKARDEQ